MRLLTLDLQGFRNHRGTALLLAGDMLHAFVGENGSGKTNVLEAVSLLSLLKSPRADDEAELVTWGEGHYRVRADLQTDAGERLRLEVVCELSPQRRRACFVNDVRLGVGEVVGQLPTVSFFPEDLHLFTGAPADRRRFLDQLLCQVSPEVLRDLVELQRLLRQRNALLKRMQQQGAQRAELEPWDRALAAVSARITSARLGLLATLNVLLPQELAGLGWAPGSITLVARGAVEASAPEQLEACVLQALQAAHERDIQLQATTVGPHREDFDVVVDGRSLTSFASRGQQRLVLVALLFLRASYLELRRGERPVVLLDDVFSELDAQHQELLLRNLSGSQILTTTAHPLPFLQAARVWSVVAGEVQASTWPQASALLPASAP
jgi:DNA replication and repair protein RecF